MSLDYLIFGGSGFVGTHLSSYLEDIGSSFLITDIVEPIKKEVSFKIFDVRKNTPLDIASSSETIIINLAAVHKTTFSMYEPVMTYGWNLLKQYQPSILKVLWDLFCSL